MWFEEKDRQDVRGYLVWIFFGEIGERQEGEARPKKSILSEMGE